MTFSQYLDTYVDYNAGELLFMASEKDSFDPRVSFKGIMREKDVIRYMKKFDKVYPVNVEEKEFGPLTYMQVCTEVYEWDLLKYKTWTNLYNSENHTNPNKDDIYRLWHASTVEEVKGTELCISRDERGEYLFTIRMRVIDEKYGYVIVEGNARTSWEKIKFTKEARENEKLFNDWQSFRTELDTFINALEAVIS